MITFTCDVCGQVREHTDLTAHESICRPHGWRFERLSQWPCPVDWITICEKAACWQTFRRQRDYTPAARPCPAPR